MGLFVKIYIPIYGRFVFISMGQTDEELLESFKECEVRKSEKEVKTLKLSSSCDGRGGILKSTDGIIRMSVYDDSDPYLRGVMAHEIQHCVFRMLGAIGFAHHEDSDEAYAYLTGFIHQEFLEAIQSSEEDSEEKGHQKDAGGLVTIDVSRLNRFLDDETRELLIKRDLERGIYTNTHDESRKI